MSMILRLLFVSLACIYSFSLWAQIEEVPLRSNYQLYLQHQLEVSNYPVITQSNIPSFRADEWCVASGDLLSICVDTAGMGENGTINIVDCQPLQFGAVSLNGICIEYLANAGVIQGTDALCIEICNEDGECMDETYDIFIHRPHKVTWLPSVVLSAGVDSMFCFDPDPDFTEVNYALAGYFLRPTGKVFSQMECFTYVASRIAGLDTVFYQANYNQCLTDTLAVPFSIIGDTLSLPFFDDFSYPGPRPDPEKWLNDQGYVNDFMAIDPVSFGVMTLDGLNAKGLPYSTNRKDTILSAYLDLSPFNETQDLTLTFYYQPGGISITPPERNDSLILEFKNMSGQWVEINRFAGINPFFPVIPDFIFRAFGIGKDYLYKGFQFRFRNLSSLTGAVHQWHIDNVRVGLNLSPQGKHTDVAFTHRPGFLTKPYTAMPWTHFKPNINDYINNDLPIKLYNHSEMVLSANPSSVEVRDLLLDQVLLDNLTLLELPPITPVNQRDLQPGRHDFLNNLASGPLVGQLATYPANHPGFLLETRYRFDQSQEQAVGDTVALRNNTVANITSLENYYAYDDGTAESAIQAVKAGSQVAQEFYAPITDTLRAIQFSFPIYDVDVTNQAFHLKIWVDDLSSDPVYQKFFVRPFYPSGIFPDSLNPFTTYVLFDNEDQPIGVEIPQGTFFVGWEQAVSADHSIPVGFDKNTPDAGMFSWYNIGDGWLPFGTTFSGALMIRPVFGPDTPNNTPDIPNAIQPVADSGDFEVYPNPSNGLLSLRSEHPVGEWTVVLMDQLGRIIHNTAYQSELDLSDTANGLYFLFVKDRLGNVLANKKVLIQH